LIKAFGTHIDVDHYLCYFV